jgi:hypothetical protein
MCDKGILEYSPDSMKLEYCIEIPSSIWQNIEQRISELIGEPVHITNPKPGEYPSDKPAYDRNTVIVETVAPNKWDTEVVRFSLEQLPGCCGVLVSYHVEVRKKYQNKGINSYLQGIREQIARHNGYTMLMCTTTLDNLAEIHILKTHGWTCDSAFVNKRTAHGVMVFTKVLV